MVLYYSDVSSPLDRSKRSTVSDDSATLQLLSDDFPLAIAMEGLLSIQLGRRG